MKDQLALARLIFDSSNDMMFVVSVEKDGSYLTQSVNKAYLSVRGFTEDQIVGKRPDQIRTAEEALLVEASFAKLIETGKPFSVREEIELKRGILISETKLTALYDSQGTCSHILGISRDVTQMVTQAKLLNERNTQLDAIFDNAPVEIFLKDTEGYFLKVNKAFAESLGIEPEDVIGKSNDYIYGNKLAALVRKRDLEVIDSKLPQRRENPIWRLDDASNNAFYSLLFPVFDEQGAVSGSGGIVADITDLKQAERQRVLAQKNFELMFNAASIGMALIEPISGRILEANQHYLALFGLRRDDIGRATIHDISHPDEVQATQENIELIGQGASCSYSRLKRYLHRDGSIVWVELRVEVLEKIDPNDAISCLVIVQDISRRRMSKIELELNPAMLNVDHGQGVDESTEEGILTVNSENIVLTYNRKFVDLWGFSKDTIAKNSGRLALKELLLKVKNPASIMKMIRQSAKNVTQTEIHEVSMKDGRVFELRSAPMLGYEDKLYGWMWSTRDLTEVKRKEEQLRRSLKMQALATFTSGISHDYNNMLSVVLGYAELLQDPRSISADECQDYVAQIIAAAKRGRSLTKKLLSFSTTQHGENTLVDLNSVIKDLKLMLSSLVPDDVQLELKLTPSICLVEGNVSDIENTIVNLVMNALAAMPSGGIVSITTHTRPLTEEELRESQIEHNDNSYVVCTVEDNGVGIAEETMERLYEPFFTTKGEEGTGLGLSQVFGCMQRCSGGILAHSSVGKGTEFRLFFPFKAESKSESITVLSQPETSKKSVLVVDDEHELRSIVCEFLGTNGFRVKSACDASEALDILQSEEINGMITDIMMPGMNGFELTKLAAQKYPELKVIMTSGYNDVVDLSIFDAQHRVSFLQKPYPLQDLVQSLNSLN